MTRHVVVASAVRTAIGSFGGSLKDHPPTALGAIVVREALARADVDGGEVDHVVFGQVIQTEPRDAYLARVIAIDGGVAKETPALTLNRLCGSGVQAIISAAQAIMLGDADIAIAGGTETMSRAPHLLREGRFGQKMGSVQAIDVLTGTLSDPFGHGLMGITAETVARKWQISRAEQDACALRSQRRAGSAIVNNRFTAQIVPVAVRRGRDTVAFETDEYPRPQTTAEELAALRPAFAADGTVTAGNSSGINDGAAALVLMDEKKAEAEGRDVMARIVGYGHAGVDPGEMGIGPVPAVRALLARTGLRIEDFDLVESNEAFAAQACAVAKELGLDPARTNPNGGAIALGHPVGATGAIVTTKLLYELVRTGSRYGLVTMCIGGGQGIALALERA